MNGKGLLALLLIGGCGGRALPQDAGPAPDAQVTGDVLMVPLPDVAPRLPDAPPLPPPPPPPPPTQCQAGQQMWCDGLTYSGWGKVECDSATGEWKKVVYNGKQLLDCREIDDGRPNTTCACYHFFFNPACCETPGCVVPPGSKGQVCPPSPGQLCDYCNPLSSECVEAGAWCIVTNAHETFCGRECETSGCPTGFTCYAIKFKGLTTKQCVPADLSCYY